MAGHDDGGLVLASSHVCRGTAENAVLRALSSGTQADGAATLLNIPGLDHPPRHLHAPEIFGDRCEQLLPRSRGPCFIRASRCPVPTTGGPGRGSCPSGEFPPPKRTKMLLILSFYIIQKLPDVSLGCGEEREVSLSVPHCQIRKVAIVSLRLGNPLFCNPFHATTADNDLFVTPRIPREHDLHCCAVKMMHAPSVSPGPSSCTLTRF